MIRSELDRPSISVVIPVFNSMPELEFCLDSVLAELDDYGKGEVLVVDNGSTDGSLEYLRAHPSSQVSVLQLPTASVGGLRNAGAEAAEGDVLCFVDSDCVLGEGYFGAVVETFHETQAAATGSKYARRDPATWIERVWEDLHARSTDGYVEYVNAGNFAVRRDAFEAVGGFREDLASGEDAELGQRLNHAGFRIFECHAVRAVHLGDPKTVVAFVRRHTWHGVGMFATAGKGRIDKPVAMLMLHLVLAAAGLLQAFVGPWPWPIRLGILTGLLFVVPAATVGYRYWQGGGGGRPLRETFLYLLYYFARARALAIIMVRWIRGEDSGSDPTETAQKTAKSFRPR